MVDINFTIVLQAINFFIFMFILKKVFWEPLMRHIDRRDALIADRKERTERLQEETQKMKEEYDERIRSAKREGLELRDGLIKQGREERMRLIGEAIDESERAISEGEARLQEDMETALAAVSDEEVERMAGMVVNRVMAQEQA